jgi:signal transduction histidine kinase
MSEQLESAQANPNNPVSGFISSYQQVNKALGVAELARQRASFLLDFSRRIHEELNYEANLSIAAEGAVPFLADACVIFRLQGEPERHPAGKKESRVTFERIAERIGSLGGGSVPLGVSSSPCRPEISMFLKELIRSKASVTLFQSDDPSFFEFFGAPQARSAFLIPLELGDENGCARNGVMTLLHNWAREFSEPQASLARDYADCVSVSLRNANLYSEARQALQDRDRFISVASHELRNPMSALKLQLELLDRLDAPGEVLQLATERVLKSRDLIKNAVKKLSDNIDRIFDLAVLRSDQFDIVRSEVDLTRLVEEIIGRCEPLLKASGCVLSKDLEAAVRLRCDPVRIEQVLYNLLSNAAKYAPRAPIQVALRSDGRQVRLSVKDHGPGISEAEQGKVFECFFRSCNGANGHSQRNGLGLGLGLFICKKIVDGHGGTISVHSVPGQGSEFVVELPV